MFANEITEEGNPVCPICKKPVYPNSVAGSVGSRGEACSTPTGLWIIHKICVEDWNALASLQ